MYRLVSQLLAQAFLATLTELEKKIEPHMPGKILIPCPTCSDKERHANVVSSPEGAAQSCLAECTHCGTVVVAERPASYRAKKWIILHVFRFTEN